MDYQVVYQWQKLLSIHPLMSPLMPLTESANSLSIRGGFAIKPSMELDSYSFTLF